MISDPLHAASWWRDGIALRRVVADLLAGEMALMRPGTRLPPTPWPQTFDLRDDLGADSLDLMGLATAMEAMLHLGRPAAANGDDGAGLLAHSGLAHWLEAAHAGLEQAGQTLTFRTSGSSGTPS